MTFSKEFLAETVAVIEAIDAEAIEEVARGIAAVREKSMRLTARLMDGARARGWRANTPENPAERAGTVSIECPHAYEVCRELLARDILVDYRPKAGVRVSPHFYNRDEECDFTLAQMEEILKTAAWEKHAATVTHA